MWILWAFLGMLVVGVKYYTALGKRGLDRRLIRVRDDLEKSRQRLREEREKQTSATLEEELMVSRVQYMKEMIEDIDHRLSSRDGDSRMAEKEEAAVLPMFTRY
jgi:hypothetical protein